MEKLKDYFELTKLIDDLQESFMDISEEIIKLQKLRTQLYAKMQELKKIRRTDYGSK